MDFVYNAALRQTRRPDLADDVTQGVFIALARKAHTLRSVAQLSPWLFSVVRYAAANAQRAQQRRQRHERAAAHREVLMLDEHASSPDAALALLDDAIASLKATDRNVVILRHLRRLEISQVAVALGISNAAVHKRLHRSIQRMREFFAARVGTEAASVEATLALAVAVPAPKGLLSVTIAGTAAGGPASPTAAMIARGSLGLLAFTKASHVLLAILMAAAVLGGSGIIVGKLMLGQLPTSVNSSPSLFLSNQISPTRPSFSPDTFTIQGNVTRPGVYQLKINRRRLNLKQAILTAGLNDSDRTSAFALVIYRDKPLYTVEFAVKDLLQAKTPPTLVKGAVVIVTTQKSPLSTLADPGQTDPAKGKYYVGGILLLRPGIYDLANVIDGQGGQGVTLRQAIIAAGLETNYDPDKITVQLIGRNPLNEKAVFKPRAEAAYSLRDVLNEAASQPQVLDNDVIYLLGPRTATTQATQPH
jgi:RNA polymerase sigma factor (sigma-70 family)